MLVACFNKCFIYTGFRLGLIYIRAKAIFSFIFVTSINTQIGNNATDWKRHRSRFRSNINAPLV